MSRSSLRLSAAVASFALLLATGTTEASLVNFTLSGVFDYADPGNSFSIATNDSITVSGTYDDSSLTNSGTEYIVFSSSNGNTMSMNFGSMTFSASNDPNYDAGMPRLAFVNGTFSWLDFYTDVGTSGYFETYPCGTTCFDGIDDNVNYVEGSWTNFSASVVPVPAAIWLFGSGLLGLFGIARRKS